MVKKQFFVIWLSMYKLLFHLIGYVVLPELQHNCILHQTSSSRMCVKNGFTSTILPEVVSVQGDSEKDTI